MKHILVPTDFSTQADHAMELAARLAQQQGAAVHLVNSVEVPATWQEGRFTSAVLANKPPREQQALYPEARERVGQARHALEQRAKALSKKKLEVSHEVVPNAAWQEILRLAKAKRTDLIVMGTNGAGALKEAFVGSNTQRVVRMAEQPVITLQHAAPKRFANVVILVGPLEDKPEKAIARMLLPLAGERAKYHLLYVNTPGYFQDSDSAMEAMRKVAAKLEPEVSLNTCDHFSVAEGAIAFARRAGMDLIAVPTHGRSAISAMLNASVAEALVNHSPVPVITVRIN